METTTYEKLFLALLGSSSAHAEASRRAFAVLGLTAGQPKILYILRRENGMVQKKLAALCGVRAPTLTSLLCKTEGEGLVRRERSVTAGKASQRVFLTEKGKAAAERVEEEVERLEAQGLGGFTEGEREELLHLLSRVTENLKE